MTEHAVVIAGGGPTGLMLAGELALAGVDVAIVERRASPDLPGSRAGGLHSRAIEVLDQRGIAEPFLSEGQVAQVAGFASVRLASATFPHGTAAGSGRGSGHREQSQHSCFRPRLRPAGHDEGKDRQLEEKRLELSGSLDGDDRDDHGEGERREGHSGQVGPQAEGHDR